MTWQIILFNWTGYVLIMSILFAGLSWFGYWLFNEWLKSFAFCWRIGFITHLKMHGGVKDFINKTHKDKDGTKFKIVEVKK